jgi:DNA-binding transcriptional regulator YhcF (GntR family)
MIAEVRFWLTKNSEVPLREQLTRQVVLAILSEDLPSGHKMPSVRALAQRHRIHANTVSAAYHDLLEQGWLELRRGSGLYVRALKPDGGEIEPLLTTLLQTAHRQGFEPGEVLRRLEQMVRPRRHARVLVAEPEPELRAILLAEIVEHVGVPTAEYSEAHSADGALVVALAGHAQPNALPLRLRSVRGSLEGQSKPRADSVISIVSRSATIRRAARSMLIAVGLDPDSLTELDPAVLGWQDRLSLSALVVSDGLAARELPPGCPARIFRVIADSSIEELKQLCDTSR